MHRVRIDRIEGRPMMWLDDGFFNGVRKIKNKAERRIKSEKLRSFGVVPRKEEANMGYYLSRDAFLLAFSVEMACITARRVEILRAFDVVLGAVQEPEPMRVTMPHRARNIAEFKQEAHKYRTIFTATMIKPRQR